MPLCRTLLGIFLGLGLLVTEAQAQAPSLSSLASEYLSAWWPAHPSAATAAGVHAYDRLLEDVTPAAIQQEIQRQRDFLARLERLEAAQLTPDARADRAVLEAHIRSALWRLEEVRVWETRPAEYADLAVRALWPLLTRQFAPTKARLEAVSARLRLYPKWLKQARLNLKNPPELATRFGLRRAAVVADFLEKEPPRRAQEQGGDRGSVARTQRDSRAAAAALREFGRWLETDLLPRSKGSAALGPETYARRFRGLLGVDLTPELTWATAESELKGAQAALIAAAAKAVPGRPLPQAFDGQSPLRPGEAVKLYRDAARQARDFLARTQLAPLPDPDRLQFDAAPVFLAAEGPVFDPAGVFEPSLESLCLTPAPSGREEILLDVLHCGYPGHYLQREAMTRTPAVVRKVFPNIAFVEGWAAYAARVALDHGLAASPRALLLQRRAEARVALDAIIDIGLHTGRLDPAAAAHRLIAEGYWDVAAAESRVERALLHPGELSAAFAGKMELARLLGDLKRKMGAAFVLKEIHPRLLSLGAPPPATLRSLLAP